MFDNTFANMYLDISINILSEIILNYIHLCSNLFKSGGLGWGYMVSKGQKVFTLNLMVYTPHMPQ